MALVKYIGHKATKADNVANTKTVWVGHGDVRSVPNKALEALLKHPTVWELVSAEDLTTAAETALAGGLVSAPSPAPQAVESAGDFVSADIVRRFITDLVKYERLTHDEVPPIYLELGLGTPPPMPAPPAPSPAPAELPPDDADAKLDAEKAANTAAGVETPKDPPQVSANMSHTNPEDDEDGDVASRPGTLAKPPGVVTEPAKATGTGKRNSPKA